MTEFEIRKISADLKGCSCLDYVIVNKYANEILVKTGQVKGDTYPNVYDIAEKMGILLFYRSLFICNKRTKKGKHICTFFAITI